MIRLMATVTGQELDLNHVGVFTVVGSRERGR